MKGKGFYFSSFILHFSFVFLLLLPASSVRADDDLLPYIDGDYEGKADSLEYCLVENFMNKNKGTFWSTPNDVEHSSQYIYWQQAHAIDVIIYAYQRYVDEGRTEEATTYKRYMERWFTNYANNYAGSTFTNPYTDDMAWIGLSILHLGEALDVERYYRQAKTIYTVIRSRRKTDSVGTYLPWNTDSGSKANACTLSPACLLATKLFEHFNDSTYLEDAETWYNYLIDSGITKSDGRVEEPPLTYTQGTLGEALRRLYHITGKSTYKTRSGLYFTYAFTNSRCTSGGLLRHEGTSMDQSIFKAVLIPYAVNFVLDDAMSIGQRRSVLKYLQNNAAALWSHLDLTRYPKTYCPYYWGERFNYSTTASMGAMVSGASLLENVCRMHRSITGATGIVPPNSPLLQEGTGEASAYDLTGRPVESSATGIIIHDGKKILKR
jgi:predicted alpha-1,6-mannanase (GH76 family)